MIAVVVDIDIFLWRYFLNSSLESTGSLILRYIKCTGYVSFSKISCGVIFKQYVMGRMGKEIPDKNVELVHCRQFFLHRFGPSCSWWVFDGFYIITLIVMILQAYWDSGGSQWTKQVYQSKYTY